MNDTDPTHLLEKALETLNEILASGRVPLHCREDKHRTELYRDAITHHVRALKAEIALAEQDRRIAELEAERDDLARQRDEYLDCSKTQMARADRAERERNESRALRAAEKDRGEKAIAVMKERAIAAEARAKELEHSFEEASNEIQAARDTRAALSSPGSARGAGDEP